MVVYIECFYVPHRQMNQGGRRSIGHLKLSSKMVMNSWYSEVLKKMYLVRHTSTKYLNILLKDTLEKDHDVVREDARALMAYIQAKSQEFDPDRKVCLHAFPPSNRH